MKLSERQDTKGSCGQVKKKKLRGTIGVLETKGEGEGEPRESDGGGVGGGGERSNGITKKKKKPQEPNGGYTEH